jgi:hypothetical protein
MTFTNACLRVLRARAWLKPRSLQDVVPFLRDVIAPRRLVHYTPEISRGRLAVGADGKVLPGDLSVCGDLIVRRRSRTRAVKRVTCLACAYWIEQGPERHRG